MIYTLIDPSEYAAKRVLVVGGGDSALEAAISIAQEPETTVSLSYRSEAFSRAKRKNREKLQTLVKNNQIQLLLRSQVKAITPQTVELEIQAEGGAGIDDGQKALNLDNDAVIICAGGILPTQFLRDTGIEIETKFGHA